MNELGRIKQLAGLNESVESVIAQVQANIESALNAARALRQEDIIVPLEKALDDLRRNQTNNLSQQGYA